MTYLECVNQILLHLRENAASSVTDSNYTRLIGRLVNNAKREVEDAHPWACLKTQIDADVVSTDTTATFTGTNQRTRIIAVYNDTNDYKLIPAPRDRIQYWREIGTQSSGQPGYWALKGWDSNEDIQIELYPTVGASYTLTIDAINPQDDIASNQTAITVPGYPVYLRGLALALAERGDDQGQSYAQLMKEYQIALNDAATLDEDLQGVDRSWKVA